MSATAFGDVPLSQLLDDLASRSATPGGGSGAALAGALGAALVAMLARVHLAGPAALHHRRLLEAVAEGADEARERLLRLANEDAAAFEAVRAAQRLPGDTQAQDATRRRALQGALHGATEVPLQVMERLLEVIGLAKNAVETGSSPATTDGASGSEICRAALKAAGWAVLANLKGIEDETYVKLARTRMDEMTYMGIRVATNVESFVNDLVRHDPA